MEPRLAFTDQMTGELAAMVQRVQRSLVVVQNERRGFGAGVIWPGQDLVLTNQHVIQAGRQVRVTDAAGRAFTAQVVAQDGEIDLALLYAAGLGGWPAQIADSRALRVGQIVFAVGHPWGERSMLTAGLISGLGQAQTRGSRGQVEIIRSDVRLAPGNSGGPLVNAAGAVVGINTMLVGGDLGLAIASHVASRFVEASVPQTISIPRRTPSESML